MAITPTSTQPLLILGGQQTTQRDQDLGLGRRKQPAKQHQQMTRSHPFWEANLFDHQPPLKVSFIEASIKRRVVMLKKHEFGHYGCELEPCH